MTVPPQTLRPGPVKAVDAQERGRGPSGPPPRWLVSRYRFLPPPCAYQDSLLDDRLRPSLFRLALAGRPHRLVYTTGAEVPDERCREEDDWDRHHQSHYYLPFHFTPSFSWAPPPPPLTSTLTLTHPWPDDSRRNACLRSPKRPEKAKGWQAFMPGQNGAEPSE